VYVLFRPGRGAGAIKAIFLVLPVSLSRKCFLDCLVVISTQVGRGQTSWYSARLPRAPEMKGRSPLHACQQRCWPISGAPATV
jgi:hypothetical protein